jgi:hypothetical protein
MGEIENERFAAARRGETKFNGNPCRHGHSGERFVGNGYCCECQRLANAATKNKLRELMQAAREGRQAV